MAGDLLAVRPAGRLHLQDAELEPDLEPGGAVTVSNDADLGVIRLLHGPVSQELGEVFAHPSLLPDGGLPAEHDCGSAVPYSQPGGNAPPAADVSSPIIAVGPARPYGPRMGGAAPDGCGMTLAEMCWKLALAAAAGAAVGVEREGRDRPAGVRTHMFVCVGSALITFVSVHLAGTPA